MHLEGSPVRVASGASSEHAESVEVPGVYVHQFFDMFSFHFFVH
jgi:hypothetical protein